MSEREAGMADVSAAPRLTGVARLVLRLLVAAGLAIDAYVHFNLASNYDLIVKTFSEGWLFRAEAIAATVAAVMVLVVRRWITDVFAFLVAATGVAVLLIYRYVDVGAFGPVPNMYEPVWFGKKTLAAIAEGVAALAALPLVIFPQRRR